MKRQIVTIDEAKCDGCGLCVPNCHEGALQIIDGKARLISDLFCDGLGACIGYCPQGAITMEEREAEPYDEAKVMEIMITKGNNTIQAHLQHLLEHGEMNYLRQAFEVLKRHDITVDISGHSKHRSLRNLLEAEGLLGKKEEEMAPGCGCQSSAPIDLTQSAPAVGQTFAESNADIPSALQNWPVQMHLINPDAGYFKGADLLIAADCTAFTMGAFHQQMMRGKKVVIACPKLDTGRERYVEKFTRLIDDAKINTITIAMMEVPCCGGLMQLLQMAIAQAQRKVPVKQVIISISGQMIKDEWI